MNPSVGSAFLYYLQICREDDERNERFQRNEHTEGDALFRDRAEKKKIASGSLARIRIRYDIGRKRPRSEGIIREDLRLISLADTIITARHERRRIDMNHELARREELREERKLFKIRPKPTVIILTKTTIEVLCEDCAICLNKPTKANSITTECGHEFCKGCYKNYLALDRNKSCPMCRKNNPKITSYRVSRAKQTL